MRIKLERYIVNTDISGDKIIGCSYDHINNRYIIKIRCGGCGLEYIKTLDCSKPMVFNCSSCKRGWYMLGKESIKHLGLIVGYKIINKTQYNKLRKQYRMMNNKDISFMRYIQSIYDKI